MVAIITIIRSNEIHTGTVSKYQKDLFLDSLFFSLHCRILPHQHHRLYQHFVVVENFPDCRRPLPYCQIVRPAIAKQWTMLLLRSDAIMCLQWWWGNCLWRSHVYSQTPRNTTTILNCYGLYPSEAASAAALCSVDDDNDDDVVLVIFCSCDWVCATVTTHSSCYQIGCRLRRVDCLSLFYAVHRRHTSHYYVFIRMMIYLYCTIDITPVWLFISVLYTPAILPTIVHVEDNSLASCFNSLLKSNVFE